VRALALALCLLLASCHTAPSKEKPASVPRVTLLEFLKTSMPAKICEDGTYFMACFELTHEECLLTANEQLLSCIGQYESELPSSVTLEDMTPWAAKTGSCAGTGFEVVRMKNKIHTGDCDDADKWRQKTLKRQFPESPSR